MNNKYYITHLDDPRMPAFVTWSKPYVGKLEDFRMASQLMENGDKLTVDMLDCLGAVEEETLELKDFSWEHTNTWGFPYYLKCDAATIHQIVIRRNNTKYRLLKATFYNLYYSARKDDWKLVDHFWGQPGLLQYEETASGNKVYNILYLIDKEYKSYREALCSLSNPKELVLSSFCDEIFGDG